MNHPLIRGRLQSEQQMVGQGSDVSLRGKTSNGERTVWQSQGEIGRYPMPKQTATLQLCQVHPRTHGTMLE